VPAAEAFWADVAGVPVHMFSRATIKKHRPRTVRKNTGDTYHGCLIVRVLGSASLYRKTEGIWWAVAESARRSRFIA
jgi:hypothetical protein